jgi:hypothetical protein
MNHPITPLASA